MKPLPLGYQEEHTLLLLVVKRRTTMGFEIASEGTGFLAGSGVLVAIGVALIVLAPAKASSEVAGAVGA
jgi:hypothetical protein